MTEQEETLMNSFEPNEFLDFNGDGKVDASEELLGFMMMQDATGQLEDEENENDGYPDEDEYPR